MSKRPVLLIWLVALAACGAGEGYPPQVRPFCELAVPYIDGETSTPDEMSQIEVLAAQTLPLEVAEEVVSEFRLLRAAVRGGSEPGYSTVGVASLIGEICDTELAGIISGVPLRMEGQDSPPPLGR